MHELRKLENLHIPLWLIKDTCWMMEWRYVGVLMIVPTLFTALYILKRSFGHFEFYMSLAICFWISANSYWMCAEFFGFVEYKNYAAIPFMFGMASVVIFYFKQKRQEHIN